MRRDLAAAVEARRELGPAYEDELVQAFCDRVDQTIRARTETALDRASAGGAEDTRQFVLGLVSLGTGVPITAIASSNGGTAATVVAWAGIVGVNAAYSWGRARRR